MQAITTLLIAQRNTLTQQRTVLEPIHVYLLSLDTIRAPGAVHGFVRIGPIRFLAGCRTRRLNQG